MIVSGKKYKNLLEKYGIVLDRLTDKIHERDSLAAENAELRKEMAYWKRGNIGCATSLAAANATLDALREAVPEGIDSREFDKEHLRSRVWHILYPQPKETTDDDE